MSLHSMLAPPVTDEDFGLFVHEAELEDEDNPYCMACSSPFDTGATAVVTDDEWDCLRH